MQNLLTLWGQEVVVNEKVKAASIAAAIVDAELTDLVGTRSSSQ